MARRLFWHIYSLAEVRLTAPEPHEPFEKPGAHLFWTTSGLNEDSRLYGAFREVSGR